MLPVLETILSEFGRRGPGAGGAGREPTPAGATPRDAAELIQVQRRAAAAILARR